VARAGRSVIVLEASGRVGGRAWTQHVAGMPLDLGCGWLHSADRNPWTTIAETSGFTVDRSPTAWREQYRDLGFSPEEQQAAEAAWNAFQDRLTSATPSNDRAVDALEPGNHWNAYAEALSGYINGAGLADLSVADYLAYDRAASETNWRVREGYGTLIAAHLPDISLHLATPVSRIDHSDETVRLETRVGTVSARTAIVTVSTKVLASGAIRFSPAIDDHLHAAANLPLGLADKLFLGLGDGHGLEPDTHLLGNPRNAGTGSYYLMPFSQPVIECFFGGDGARALEHDGLAGAFAFAADELAALLGSDFRANIHLLAGSSWGKADGFGGSYSHALPGHATARAALARPADRLFFAGEATHATDFSTAHGAYHSGVRAAEEAIDRLSAR
jgi:monoamine oxidase